MAYDKESIQHTFLVSTAVCVVCAIMVAAPTVALRSRQDENKRLEKQRNILAAAGLLPAEADDAQVASLFARFAPRLVELSSGRFVEGDALGYDMRAAAKDEKRSILLAAEQDPAKIRRRPKVATVYVLQEQGRLQGLVLPIWGLGLWSTLHGFVALGPDLSTVVGLTFYEHAETPGLGGEVDNPRWKSQWSGKRAFDAEGQLAIHVLKGRVDPNNALASHQIDGLSGATITTFGVDHLVRFWLGEQGFGPLLLQLRQAAAPADAPQPPPAPAAGTTPASDHHEVHHG
ncbi:MAG: Na(+)-translocating NADH-quinone reductase subunit C [Myxococcota bacterium]|jgi:Na+-transporting NADH:ubiquinone oxidoreductase subunit C|nr:Na(+)-translocating NADH-quinone reductase subunit C [Myxococcota bacterium]